MKARITQSAVQRWSKNPEDRPVDVYSKTVGGFVARVRPSGVVSYFLKYESVDGKSRNFTIGRDTTRIKLTGLAGRTVPTIQIKIFYASSAPGLLSKKILLT